MSIQPTYQARNERYGIDRCEPQKRAVSEGKIEFHALTKGHYPGRPVPRNVLPGLNSIGYWSAGAMQDWGEDPHRNEGMEILFLETGSIDFTADQKTHHLHAGHFTITRPWQLHKLGAPNIGPGRLHWLILDVGVRRPHQEWTWPKWVVLTRNDLARLTRKLRHNENPVWTSTPPIAASFREIARCVEAWDQPHAISRLAVSLNQLLIGILDALVEQQTQENEQLTSRKRAVEMFLRDLEAGRANVGEAWTLNRMAAHCSMGVTAFSKYCRELVNIGPMEYLNRCRLDLAARRLREDKSRSITEIAFDCGFNSSQYFSTRFRQRFHQSPRRFVSKD
ncbi:MAG TPA: AraC family transcriptional regulator [Dongiaceae bacterium]|jgi:AraC family L-rhamnose operon regulatory protein RhaS|nr:AraC family transcriptional regulator [Dongiaceae bacterium]